MPFEDHIAAARLTELRENAGLSIEGLAAAIKRYAQAQGWIHVHGAVDAFTLRRIEATGHCPSERVRLVIALFFQTTPREIWNPAHRREVERVEL